MTAIDTGSTQPNVSTAERTVSAIFKDREQIDNVIPRLTVEFPATTFQ